MYIPLNIRTDYSLLHSMIKIKELVKFAKENNLKALTITDDNMFGTMEFYLECTKNNIKPIIGLNIKYNDEIVVLYAINYDGYVNLLKLSSNEITLENLKKYSNNILCILPCTSRKIYNEIKEIYNKLFISYENKEEKEKIKTNNKIYMKEIRVLNKEDLKYLNYLEAIKENKLVTFKEYDNYLNLDVEENSFLYDLINIKIEKQNNLLPHFDNSFKLLKEKCKEGLKKRFGSTVGSKYLERLKYELETINEMGFNDYFLIVSDYVRFAKENGILVGPGRGSAVGSLVAYTLEITEIDPLKYGLLFERFLNKNRITMPDIDIDFDGNRREEVINYCKEKYGEKNVSGIITFSTLGTKAVLKDLGKVMDINPDEVDYLTKLLDNDLDLKNNLNLDKIRNHLSKNNDLDNLYRVALKLEGLKKTTSVNASGIIICNKELDNFVPLVKHNDLYLAGYTMNFLEDIGLLKMDFLALKNLTLISSILNEVNINLNDIPLNDKETFEIFNKSNTLGIFQFETEGMRNVLKKYKINKFEDLYNLSAIFRPGPKENIDTFIKRKTGRESIDYYDKSLENVLKSTYGIIVYQEQIMLIANIMASYSLGEADILRRAMSKKKEDILINEKDKFIKRSIDNGYSEEFSTTIYNLILKFAEYGFNKSHSVAYALISYQMAYLKAHYKEIFYKNLLDYCIGSISSTNEYIIEAKNLSVKFNNPDINVSEYKYVINNGMFLPLTLVINYNACKNILEERKNGKFIDIYDFLKRVDLKIFNKELVNKMILVGCFDSFNTRKTLIENLDVIYNYIELGSDLVMKPDLVQYNEYNKKELTIKEYEILGFYLNNNPITEYRKEKNIRITLSNVSSYVNKVIDVIAFINYKKEIVTKDNKKMCFIELLDDFTNLEGVIFDNAFVELPEFKINDIVKIRGRIEMRKGKIQIIVNKMELLN